MSRKKCRRKVWALVNPIEFAVSGAAIAPRKDLDQLLMREIGALDAIVRGHGTLKEWQDLAALNNLTMTLAGQGVGPEALEAAQKAEAALIDAAARFQSTGRMGFTGPAIQAIRDVIEFHDLQRSSISRSDYEKAIQLTIARIRSGHATIDLDKTLGKPFPVTA
jgi:hypothetical protein